MGTVNIRIPEKPKRKFLPEQFSINNWSDLEPFYKELERRNIQSSADLEKWILDLSELEAIVSENMAWRYIKMTCDTTDKELVGSYTHFITEIEPHIAPFTNTLHKKLIASPFIDQLDAKMYFVYLRGIKKSLELFREENIPLLTEINNESQKYGAITGAQSIEHNGEEITIQKAAVYLKNGDRKIRETVYKKIQSRRDLDERELNELFDRLIVLRNKVALNAGFNNYRDYKFEDLGRFDYTAKDCFDFQEAIRKNIVPLNVAHEKERKEKLKLDTYRPWDTEVDVDGKAPLHPFKDGAELLDKSIRCFYEVNDYFGECLETMKAMHHLSLESRIGKAPGGYNYPLYETGVPFIFMNAVGTHRDLVTMVHEGGHAIHSFLSKDLPVTEFKSMPSEVAELASMSMELISMEHWQMFFPNEDDYKRAKAEQLDKILKSLPWIASIDKFQHWIYENPEHTVEQRYSKWEEIMKEFGTGQVDYNGLENSLRRSWQAQLHLYEVPFYYIEYGMAQLGAIAVWRNYKRDPKKALDQYSAALSLGYTATIGEIYRTAGIKFDFSDAYVKELADFVKDELQKLV
jgi:oligoendopeptidase F